MQEINSMMNECPYCGKLITVNVSEFRFKNKIIKHKERRLRVTNEIWKLEGNKCPKCKKENTLILLEQKGIYHREGSVMGPDIKKYGWHHADDLFLCGNCKKLISYHSMLEQRRKDIENNL